MLKSISMAVSLIVLLLLGSCQKAVDPGNTQQGSSADNLELSAAQGLDDDLGYMEPTFSPADSVDALFAISWGRFRLPFFRQNINMGHASAVAFKKDANPGPYFHLGGLDMGDVTLTMPDDTLQLKPFRGAQDNFVYLSLNPPGQDGNNSGENGMIHARQIFSFFPFSQVNFNADAVYSFSTTGSNDFPAISTSLHTPESLLTISGLTDGQDVSIDNGLTITWSGATERSKILVAVTIGHRFDFRGGARGDKNDLQNMVRLNFENFPIIIKTFKQNIGSVTISKSEIQDLLNQVDSKTLAINVSAIDFEKEAISNRMIGKMIRMHDRLFVTVK